MSPSEQSRLEALGRAPEAIALFNVALTSELLVNACWHKAQTQGGPSGLSWPAAFVILPLSLHPPTRESLPNSSRVTLAAWAVRNPHFVADMDYRVAIMASPTKRAIRHGLRVRRLELVDTELVALGRPKKPVAKWPEELKASVRAARLAGQWFGVTDVGLAFELLGVGS